MIARLETKAERSRLSDQEEMQLIQARDNLDALRGHGSTLKNVSPEKNLNDLKLHSDAGKRAIDHINREVEDNIKPVYATWQQSRGDGNCFWRAFGYSLLQQLLVRSSSVTDSERSTLLQTLVERLQDAEVRAEDNGFYLGNEIDAVQAKKRLLARLKFVGRGGRSWIPNDEANQAHQGGIPLTQNAGFVSDAELLRAFNTDGETDYIIIKLLRRLTSKWALIHQDEEVPHTGQTYADYGKTLEGNLDKYIQTTIEPMGQDAQGFMFPILPLALGFVRLHIVYLDRQQSQPTQVFEPDSRTLPIIDIDVLFKPGHYDILRRRFDDVEEEEDERKD